MKTELFCGFLETGTDDKHIEREEGSLESPLHMANHGHFVYLSLIGVSLFVCLFEGLGRLQHLIGSHLTSYYQFLREGLMAIRHIVRNQSSGR